MAPHTDGAPTALDPELAERCIRIPTGTWSDALDTLRIEGVMDGLAMRSGTGRVAGVAVTVQEDAAPLGTYTFENFDVGGIIEAAPAGSIAVIAMQAQEVSTFGGLSAHAAARRGIQGIVIDGGCRDIEEIRSIGLYVASRHVTPRSGKLRVNVVAIGADVTCAGVRVRAGDCVIGDETGIVVVPFERLTEVLAIAERMEGSDRQFESELSAGARFGAVAAKLGYV